MSGGGEDVSPTMNPHSNPFYFGRSLGRKLYVSSSQRREFTDFPLVGRGLLASGLFIECSGLCPLAYLYRGFVSLYSRWTWKDPNEQIDEQGGNSTVC